MPISNYPHGFTNGVTVRDLPLILTQSANGNVFWVDSTKGSNGNKGTFTKPLATIDFAIGLCTANQDDTIIVAAGHTETVATVGGLAIDKAGLTIVFLGEGSNKGTVKFNGVVGASMTVSAANTTLINPRFLTDLDALTSPITITAANCKIVGAEYYDAAAKAATNGVVASTAATGLKIYGYKYYASTTGTQKATHIQLTAVANAELVGIDIVGDFSTAPINAATACTVMRLENIKVNNTNSGPLPAIALHANCTGMGKNIDARVVSGTTYVSSVAKLNWDIQCLGYAADGTGGDPIGTAGSGTIEAKVDAIQADIGDPSARTNFQSLETMIGIPDAANSNLDDMLRTGFDSTAITSNANGSVMERLEFLQAQTIPDLGGLVFSGTCDAGMVASTTSIVAADLAGYGDSFFNGKYYMQVIKNANSVGNAPEKEVRAISAYTSATGTFTTSAFTVNVEASDNIMVLHESLVMLGRDDADNAMDTTNVVSNADGSVVERQEYLQAAVATVTTQVNKIDGLALSGTPVANSLATFLASGGTSIGTALAVTKSIIDAIGSDGATLVYGAGSTLGAIGTEFWVKKTLTSSAIVQAGVDITGVSSTGELAITDVIVKTDATGLATGTNFVVCSDNANGLANIFVETVANLGANKTMDLAGASVTKIKTVLSTGKKLIAKSTVADCTGGGTIDIYVKFQRLAAGATVAAA